MVPMLVINRQYGVGNEIIVGDGVGIIEILGVADRVGVPVELAVTVGVGAGVRVGTVIVLTPLAQPLSEMTNNQVPSTKQNPIINNNIDLFFIYISTANNT